MTRSWQCPVTNVVAYSYFIVSDIHRMAHMRDRYSACTQKITQRAKKAFGFSGILCSIEPIGRGLGGGIGWNLLNSQQYQGVPRVVPSGLTTPGRRPRLTWVWASAGIF